MNREIKFRAFHIESKTMYWFDIMNGNHNNGNGYIGMAPFGEEITKKRYRDNMTLVDPYQCEIMQFTGLTDKNGKEIYDGDFDNDYEVVSWCENKNGWAMKTYDHPTKEIIHCNCYNCEGNYEIFEIIRTLEIIGNIYENPELIQN